MAGVKFEHVTKRFQRVTAIDDLCLEVPDKEFLVIVGPSGCGKTTALRLLAGLEEASEGRVIIGDRVVNDVPPKDRNVAMVFQSYALYPHMNVYDNMAFGLRLRGMPKEEIDRRVTEAARILGIDELRGRKPGQLSGGQRQRVAVGRAIVREPAVFLFDEPLSDLDAKLRVQMRAELIKLHQRLETTFIYVTHDQAEAMTMASHIAVLREGVLQQLGAPQELYDHPANTFVAGFIGSPAMNFFDATVAGTAEELWLDAGAFKVAVPEDHRRWLSGHLGVRVVFGLRPEDIHDHDYTPPGILAAPIEAQVDLTEPMGSEVYLTLLAGGQQFIARVDPRSRARPGQTVQVMLNMANMHAFDPDTGAMLGVDVW
ncbi:MAG TPA: ABC transporter ATP-binding protein [Dehalococcoidia bacterium]|nr:ABC transporter ATP-binding protein [Dehalococcoidia bacterium]